MFKIHNKEAVFLISLRFVIERKIRRIQEKFR